MLKVIKSKLRVISLVIFLDLSKYNLQGVVACVFPQVRTQYVQVQTQSPHLHLCRNSTLRRQGMTLQIYRYHRKHKLRCIHYLTLLSFAVLLMLFHSYPSSFVFVSLVLLHVPFDLPGFLFSGKVHFNILIFDGILLFFIVFQSVKQ